TTLDEYRKKIEKDPAFERRFQPVRVDEPTEAESEAILRGLREKYEAHHRLRIRDDALTAAVRLSARYVSDRFLPDKAIDLMDEAAANVRLRLAEHPSELTRIDAQIEESQKEKEACIERQEYEQAAALRDRISALKAEKEAAEAARTAAGGDPEGEVGADEVAQVVSRWTGIPAQKMTRDESDELLRLEETLRRRVVGQEEAISAVARAMRRARAGLRDPHRPIGSFLFLGPTGVGKTELSKALAAALFGSEDAMIRIDMSEYMEKHTVSRLVGSPPGYVGYEEGGQLTEKVRRRPYSLILLDEVEKAHPDFFNILLQILEDGLLTDSQGRRVNFRNTLIIMTSNIGASQISASRHLGFGSTAEKVENYTEMKAAVMQGVQRFMRPEFINRLDEQVVFRALGMPEIREISAMMMREIVERLGEQGITLNVTDEAIAHLAEKGFDPNFGARPLRRLIEKTVEDAMSSRILTGEIGPGDTVRTAVTDGQLDFVKETAELPEPAEALPAVQP
ncbi:MAG: ATP-dependent Clp protease ATP-binding subunit, partial [Oscillospiraceae bacterium]|nr:ATP-dependent Clp protease ATP-binding subunit [Oscillospiraceae bacterium]